MTRFCKREVSVSSSLCTKSHIHHEFFHADGRLAFQRSGIRFLISSPNGIHDDKMVSLFSVADGVTFCRSSLLEHTGASALHLLKVILLRTSRMKIRHSIGFTSVPVAIISTVTAIRGL